MSEEPIDKKTHKYKKSTIINPVSAKEKPNASNDRHYVDNTAFYNAMKERRDLINSGQQPKISNFIGECVMKIAENLAKKYQFSNYKFRDEMIADAIEHCIRYIDSFDPDKSKNPFSYFTQTCYYQFLARIAIERKQTYIKCKATLNSVVMTSLSELNENSGEEAEHIHDNFEFDSDFMEKFVSDYEAKMMAKKTIKKSGLEIFEDDPE